MQAAFRLTLTHLYSDPGSGYGHEKALEVREL